MPERASDEERDQAMLTTPPNPKRLRPSHNQREPFPRILHLGPRRLRAAALTLATFGLASPATLSSLACQVDAGGHFESLSAGTYGPDSGGGDVPGTGGDGADETGENPFPPDAKACVFETAACSDDVDCCMSDEPPSALVPGACPAAGFPANWSCVSDECVHENGGGDNGCDTHSDCSNLLEGYVCVIVGGSGRCAPECDQGNGDADCLDADGHGLPPGFTCESATSTPLGNVDFCQHVVS